MTDLERFLSNRNAELTKEIQAIINDVKQYSV